MQRTASSVMAIALLALVAILVWGGPAPSGDLDPAQGTEDHKPQMMTIRAILARDVRLDIDYNESQFGPLDWSIMELSPRVTYPPSVQAMVQNQLLDCPAESWCVRAPIETPIGLPPDRDLRIPVDPMGIVEMGVPTGAQLEWMDWSDGNGDLVIRGCGVVGLHTEPEAWRVHPAGAVEGRSMDEDLLVIIPVGGVCISEG